MTSGVRVIGRRPSPRSMLERLDANAKRAGAAAKRDVQVIVAATVPGNGKLKALTKVRLTRIPRGVQLSVGIPRGAPHDQHATAAQVSRWVQRGTGLYRIGPGSKRRIRADRFGRRLVLPGGRKVWSVKGQRPNPYMVRIRVAADPRVKAAFRAAARDISP